MPTLTYIDSSPFQHLEVEPGVWFYMNHFEAQEEHAAHSHNYLELAFILSGTVRHVTVKGESCCCAGSIIVIPPGAWHAYLDCDQLEVVNCLCSPQMLGRELAWLADDEALGAALGIAQTGGLQEVVKIDIENDSLNVLRADLERLEQAYAQQAHRVVLVSYLLQVLATMRAPILSQLDMFCVSDRLPPAVARAIDLFKQSLNYNWTLEDLAGQLNLNPCYLVRLFRNEVGMPPMKFLAQERAKLAANLLLSTSLRIGEIGMEVGWSDPKVFARKFRQHYGLRASDYRKQMLGAIQNADL
jgi:AraC family L-rhamnose operon transcriptional activator RhaR